MLEITWSEKMKKNSIFKLPDLNYQWKCITKDGATKRWMYQTDLIIKNLNPYELPNKMNYVIQVGYETQKDSTKALNKNTILILDISTKIYGSSTKPKKHQYYVLIGQEEKYLMKKKWGKLKLIPVIKLPKMAIEIERLVKKLLN